MVVKAKSDINLQQKLVKVHEQSLTCICMYIEHCSVENERKCTNERKTRHSWTHVLQNIKFFYTQTEKGRNKGDIHVNYYVSIP